jgi:hypothetical protein
MAIALDRCPSMQSIVPEARSTDVQSFGEVLDRFLNPGRRCPLALLRTVEYLSVMRVCRAVRLHTAGCDRPDQ